MRNLHEWTDRLVAELTRLRKAGFSASQIAARLNSDFGTGFTRSAIIGKIHRLGINHDPVKGKPLKAYKARRKNPRIGSQDRFMEERIRKRLNAVAPPELPAQEKIDADVVDYDMERKRNGLVLLRDLEEHECRWPIGDPKDDDFGFCAAPRVPGQAYCAEHTARAFDTERTSRRGTLPLILRSRKAHIAAQERMKKGVKEDA